MSNACFTVEGITDERTTCDCCGKSNLKRTVVLRPADGGEHVFYGVTCAAYALRVPGKYTAKTAGDFVAKARAVLAARAKHAAEMERMRSRAQAEANRTGRAHVVARAFGRMGGGTTYSVKPADMLRCDYLVSEDAMETFQPA